MGQKGCTDGKLLSQYEKLSIVRDDLVLFRDMYRGLHGCSAESVEFVFGEVEKQLEALRQDMGL